MSDRIELMNFFFIWRSGGEMEDAGDVCSIEFAPSSLRGGPGMLSDLCYLRPSLVGASKFFLLQWKTSEVRLGAGEDSLRHTSG